MARRVPPVLHLIGLLLAVWSTPVAALDKVFLQLKWVHAFQFAGYYAAKAKGYYRDAGLEVDIRPAQPGMDVPGSVLKGEAEYGVGTSSLLLEPQGGQTGSGTGCHFSALAVDPGRSRIQLYSGDSRYRRQARDA
ncbi:MAG: ABC transporter substrate-binding protein [Halopseudomonas sp.]